VRPATEPAADSLRAAADLSGRLRVMPTTASLLLLIPAYNEEQRIEPVLRDYAEFLQQHHRGAFQIVVLLNACVDNTLGVVQRAARQ